MAENEISTRQRVKPLYIPANALDNDDYISGIGKKEVRYIVIASLAGILISIIFFIYLTDFLVAGIGIGFALIALTITIFRRNKYDNSLIDNLRCIRRYHKMQKHYEYKYYNVYEGRVDDGEETARHDGK